MHAHRGDFERHQGWIIKTMKHEPSPEQDEYAPVIYSQETISYIEGLDMMSGEVCSQRRPCLCFSGFQFALCCWFAIQLKVWCLCYCSAGGPGEHPEVQGHWEGRSYQAIQAHVQPPRCCVDVSCLPCGSSSGCQGGGSCCCYCGVRFFPSIDRSLCEITTSFGYPVHHWCY